MSSNKNYRDLHIIITGGTIDSIFDITQDAVVVNDQSVVGNYLSRIIRPHFTFTVEIVTLKDSRLITDNVRADILDAIRRSPKKNIIITHGTYTLPETAAYLLARIGDIPEKTIVLTGSFYPIKGFSESDAPFNLGFAIAGALLREPGVYVAMNGKFFDANTVYKNFNKGRFEETDETRGVSESP